MARKVFISILGTGYYNRTKYFLQNTENYVETRFIQEATVKLLTYDWDEKDKAYFFLTKKSKITNWKHPAQKEDYRVKNGERDAYKGLEKRIKELDLNYGFETVDIPDGNNEQEIWQIFEEVFNILEENDEVYFDITHAFRSIPMLVMVLINYAKFLKNIKVKSISYGNWEGRDKDNNLAPIINLTAFSELQDWTSAANDFVSFGNVKKITQLTSQEINPILKDTKGKDITASILRKVSKNLNQFIKSIQTNNGPELIAGETIKNLQQSLKDLNNTLIEPLNPILNRIELEINKFYSEKNILNGFKAVDFCIENGLIPQAYTLLQETIITLVLTEIDYDIKNKTYRTIVSSVFEIKGNNYPESEWKGAAANDKELTRLLLGNNIIANTVSIFIALTNKRNIINHAGFNEKSSPKVFDKLHTDIIKYNEAFKKLI